MPAATTNHKRNRRSAGIASLLFTVIVVSGCQSAPGEYQAATVKQLSAAQLSEIQGIVAGAVNRKQITLGTNAFTTTHILVLEPAVGRTPQGTIATGTTTTRPETFHMLWNGRQCVLQHLSTGQRYPLSFPCPR